jgi:hypothetical protein
VSCTDAAIQDYNSDGSTRTSQYRLSKISEYRSAGYTVIETDWKYTPVVHASVVSPSRTPPKPVPVGQPVPSGAASIPTAAHVVCWADFDPKTRYYSAVFDGTHGDYGVWMTAFKDFLEQKYRYTGAVRCNKQPNRGEAQKYRDEMVSSARSLTLGDGSKARIIETGWVYK